LIEQVPRPTCVVSRVSSTGATVTQNAMHSASIETTLAATARGGDYASRRSVCTMECGGANDGGEGGKARPPEDDSGPMELVATTRRAGGHA
jgi:hypothetical protein